MEVATPLSHDSRCVTCTLHAQALGLTDAPLWIDLQDRFAFDERVWVDGNPPTDQAWSPAQPDGGGALECAVQRGDDGLWDDAGCDERQGAICDATCDRRIDTDGDGHPACGTDGDDGDRDTCPGAAERCGDGVHPNCDGAIDEGSPSRGNFGGSPRIGSGVASATGRSRVMRMAVALVWWLAPLSALAAELVPVGATWRYRDDGSDQGSAWRQLAFNASAWAQGSAELGYGDGDEAALVGYGPDANNKHVTTYFIRHFDVTGAAAVVRLDLRLVRDDGAVVWLNGSEAARSNMPAGAVGYQTLATASVGGTDEARWFDFALSPALLREGDNVIAVELHQQARTSSDLSFDMQLTAQTTNVRVTRGPYLQLATPTSMTLRWRTDVATTTQAWLGAAPGALSPAPPVAGTRTEHVVTLSSLAPGTRYAYAVGTADTMLSGNDAAHVFDTPPPVGSRDPVRVWVLGDSGTGQVAQRAVRNAFHAFNAGPTPDLWLMLGDNAYQTGTDGEFQAWLFEAYPHTLRTAALWPTFGNHDAGSASSATQTGPYYDQFTLPATAQAGGVASGAEAYYSFDYGNIHFVCLDSHGSSRAVGSPMLTWLATDLAAHAQEWTLAYWHHAPYARGTHDADTDAQMTEMRVNVNPILEAYGVDLVLVGHDHTYQRSRLIDGFYGTRGTYTAAHALDAGSGRPETDGAYSKPSPGAAPHEGTVYVVAGSSGQGVASAALDHPAMSFDSLATGSLVIDVDGEQLTSRFIDSTGDVLDWFAIVKPAPACVEAPEVCNGADDDCDGAVDEGPPSILDFAGSWAVVSEGAPAALAVRRTGGCQDAIQVTCTPVNAVARAGTDFDGTARVAAFAAGEPNAVCNVPTLADAAAEGNEAFSVRLSAPTGGATLGRARDQVVNIADDDFAGQYDFTALTAQVAESGGSVSFTVQRSGASASHVSTVRVTATNVTASSGADYAFAGNPVTLTFNAGVSQQSVTIQVLQDLAYECDEAFRLALGSPSSGAVLGPDRNAVVTITEDDALPEFTFTADQVAVSENGASVRVEVTRTGADAAATVSYSTTAGSATAGSDFPAIATTVLNFAAGERTKPLDIPVTNDAAAEGDESFHVGLSAPSVGRLGTRRRVAVRILDDEVPATP